jgi:hypothetical protein
MSILDDVRRNKQNAMAAEELAMLKNDAKENNARKETDLLVNSARNAGRNEVMIALNNKLSQNSAMQQQQMADNEANFSNAPLSQSQYAVNSRAGNQISLEQSIKNKMSGAVGAVRNGAVSLYDYFTEGGDEPKEQISQGDARTRMLALEQERELAEYNNQRAFTEAKSRGEIE